MNRITEFFSNGAPEMMKLGTGIKLFRFPEWLDPFQTVTLDQEEQEPQPRSYPAILPD